MKRAFDIAASTLLLFILSVPLLIIALAVRLTSKGPAIHWSKRVGRENRIFSMPKFRTMKISTPQLATHLLSNPDAYLTPIGSFLRRTSLDELPQLYSVIVGSMSLVGPRPALFNQDDLVKLRTEKGVHRLLPGVTGWAQINGRDECSIQEKVELDFEYLQRSSLLFDIRILFITVFNVGLKRGIKH